MHHGPLQFFGGLRGDDDGASRQAQGGTLMSVDNACLPKGNASKPNPKENDGGTADHSRMAGIPKEHDNAGKRHGKDAQPIHAECHFHEKKYSDNAQQSDALGG
jgi:hypothetical protein